MIVQRQTKRLCGGPDLSCHVDIGGRGRGITRGMIMYQNERTCIEVQRTLDHLTRVDRHMIDRTARLFLICDEDILAVQIKDAELFDLSMGHGGVAIVNQSVPRGNHLTAEHTGTGQTVRCSLDDLEFGRHRLAHPRQSDEPLQRSRDNPVEIPELGHECMCQRFHIAPGNGTKEHEFQKLVIRHRRSTPIKEAGPQPGSVIADVRGQLFVPRCLCRVAGKEAEGHIGKGAGFAHTLTLPQEP
jgi:hypothetical protein